MDMGAAAEPAREREKPLLYFSGLLSLFKGFAVGALGNFGIRFMGTYTDAVQRAIVFIAAMVVTGRNGALNAVVCFTFFHFHTSITIRDLYLLK